MKEIKPYWIKLLEYFCYKKRRTGLTIPFIIGAKEYFKEPNLQSTSELIHEVIGYQEQKVVLFYCNQIREYVLTIDPVFLRGYIRNAVLIENLTIIPSNSFLKGVEELNHIIDCFDIYYQTQIDSTEYSRKNESWVCFDEDDKKIIKSAYKFEYQN